MSDQRHPAENDVPKAGPVVMRDGWLFTPKATCDHEWSERGSGDLSWRECWLCGEQTPYETRDIPPERD